MDITVGCRYWLLKMPLHWSVRNEGECVTFSGDPDLGAMQLSVREKDEPVDNEDLRAFATDRVDENSVLQPVAIDSLVGFYAHSVVDDVLWREWWLRADCIMVYITYNVAVEHAEGEGDTVDAMISTLRLREENSTRLFDSL